jgi:hypothetical protein
MIPRLSLPVEKRAEKSTFEPRKVIFAARSALSVPPAFDGRSSNFIF